MKYVQIKDGIVISEFSCAQDETLWPGAQMVDDDDERYIEYFDKLSSIKNMAIDDASI